MSDLTRRLFFACEVAAPWPLKLPQARLIDPASRHLTLAFLGNVPYPPLQAILPSFPVPAFKVGPTGYFDRCLFLPERHPHVVAWNVHWCEAAPLPDFQRLVVNWLLSHGYGVDQRSFLSHVTVARDPVHTGLWQEDFVSLPMCVHGIHLYESVGNLTYRPIWSFPLLAPFLELNHTADLAFLIQAESIQGLHLHAQIALAFKYPPLLRYVKNTPLEANLDDIVIALNRLITRCDSEIGCPLKAVSFHGDVHVEQDVHQWEMIVDV